MNSRLLNNLCNKVQGIAIEAGEKLLRHQKKLDQLKVTFKKAQGAVSEADIQTEEFIIKKLLLIFPESEVLGEESFFKEHKNSVEAFTSFKKKDWVWVIDPLDGTHNFLNGLDYFCVSIALTFRGRSVLGVIYRPSSKELFYSVKEKGSFYKAFGKRVKRYEKVSNKKNLKHGMLVTGFATEKGEVLNREFELFYRVMGSTRGIRRMGSAALDLCYVTHGLFDGFWERNLSPWDVAAAGLICEEAGLTVSTYEGEGFHPYQSTIVASRKPFYKKLMGLIEDFT